MKRALALAAVVVLGAPIASPAGSPVVRAEAPAGIGFGDPFVYVVEAAVDGNATIVAPTAPFTRLGAARLDRTGSVVRLTQRVACLVPRCLGLARTKPVSLPPPRVRLGSRTIVGDAISVNVRGRVTRTAVSRGDEAYRRDTSLPAAGAASGPAWLVLAGVAAALALLAFALVPTSRTRPRPGVDTVARAIRLLRESAARDVADRRRAAALLARVARPRARALSEEAANAAWARPAPAGDDALRLAARAQRELT